MKKREGKTGTWSKLDFKTQGHNAGTLCLADLSYPWQDLLIYQKPIQISHHFSERGPITYNPLKDNAELILQTLRRRPNNDQ